MELDQIAHFEAPGESAPGAIAPAVFPWKADKGFTGFLTEPAPPTVTPRWWAKAGTYTTEWQFSRWMQRMADYMHWYHPRAQAFHPCQHAFHPCRYFLDWDGIAKHVEDTHGLGFSRRENELWNFTRFDHPDGRAVEFHPDPGQGVLLEIVARPSPVQLVEAHHLLRWGLYDPRKGHHRSRREVYTEEQLEKFIQDVKEETANSKTKVPSEGGGHQGPVPG